MRGAAGGAVLQVAAHEAAVALARRRALQSPVGGRRRQAEGVVGEAAKQFTGLWMTVTAASVLGVVALSLLELFVAFLQAFVFTFLTALFMGMSLHPQH